MNFNIKDFTGPLDLMLHMVKKHELDIYEIDLKIIIDEYINFINSLDKNDLDNKSEYLVMASELIHLKSKIILGFDEEEDDDNYEINSEEDLRNRLIEYEKYQTITNDFRELEKNRQDYFTKVPESLKEYVEEGVLVSGELGLDDLMDAFQKFLVRKKQERPLQTTITKKEITVEERRRSISYILKDKKKVDFFDLFEEITNEYIVVTFIAVLEMAKKQELIIKQEHNFEHITVEVRS